MDAALALPPTQNGKAGLQEKLGSWQSPGAWGALLFLLWAQLFAAGYGLSFYTESSSKPVLEPCFQASTENLTKKL
jgi:hypothetical protein